MSFSYWPISAGGDVTAVGSLAADLPVFGDGGSDIKSGTKSGDTNEVATVTGSLTSGHVAKWDASGNLIDGGADGGGTVTHTGALTANLPVLGNGAADCKIGTAAQLVPTLPADATKYLDGTGNFTVPAGAGNVTHTGALTADLPMFGNGVADSKVGTKTGSTNQLATATGTLTSGNPATWDASGNLVGATAAPYDVAGGLPGMPGAGATVLIFTAVRAVAFPGNFSGSSGSVGTNPTSTAAYDVKKNGSSIGTISISTGGAFTFTTTSGTAKSLAAGDRLTVIAPGSQDATLADVSFTLAGTR